MTNTPVDSLTTMSALKLPWIDSPFFPQLLAGSGLDAETADLVGRFARDGYVVFDPQIPSSVIDQAVEQLAGKFQPTTYPYYADDRRLQDGWWTLPAVKEIATAPRVLEILRILYQRDPIPFQTLNFRIGSEQRTHSDTIHFHAVPNLFMAGVWVALEDIDMRNGPLHYYPRSQKLPVYSMADLGLMPATPDNLYQQYPLYEDFVVALMQASELERAHMQVQRGEALIWSANLFHGGTPITDRDRTRLSQVTHYFFSDCLYFTPLLSNMALGRTALREIADIRTGQMVKHSYNGFPVADLTEWPPRLEGCEFAVAPEHPPASAELTQRAAAALPHGAAVAPPEPRTWRRRVRELIERTIVRR